MSTSIRSLNFHGELIGRLIEKVMVTSLVEVTFVFKTGVEVREVKIIISGYH